MKFKNDETKLLGDGEITLVVDGTGRVSGGTEAGPLGASVLDGTSDGTHPHRHRAAQGSVGRRPHRHARREGRRRRARRNHEARRVERRGGPRRRSSRRRRRSKAIAVFAPVRYIEWATKFYGKVDARSRDAAASRTRRGASSASRSRTSTIPRRIRRFRASLAVYNDVPVADVVPALGTSQAASSSPTRRCSRPATRCSSSTRATSR